MLADELRVFFVCLLLMFMNISFFLYIFKFSKDSTLHDLHWITDQSIRINQSYRSCLRIHRFISDAVRFSNPLYSVLELFKLVSVADFSRPASP